MEIQNNKTYEENLSFLDSDIRNMGVNFVVLPNGINSCFVINVNGVEVIYEPIDFCQFLLTIYGQRADKSKTEDGKSDLLQQALLFSELKSFFVLIITRMHRFTEIEKANFKALKSHDFNDIYVNSGAC